MESQRQMNLREWVERLPTFHLARRQFEELLMSSRDFFREQTTANRSALRRVLDDIGNE